MFATEWVVNLAVTKKHARIDNPMFPGNLDFTVDQFELVGDNLVMS